MTALPDVSDKGPVPNFALADPVFAVDKKATAAPVGRAAVWVVWFFEW